ncbi:hypothetical protein [Amycolatopsis sp. NPDC021455]|uniref:hypothetical protein n=1 Tax=Amycolatopsis sp. NPDC021455 TaxID=3154901 RepID=UPI0033E5B0A6
MGTALTRVMDSGRAVALPARPALAPPAPAASGSSAVGAPHTGRARSLPAFSGRRA